MRRLLASDLLPARAGRPVKALVHISFADLCQLDADSGIQDKWIEDYRARWAAHRAAASVATGDGGAWLDGDAARAIACDAMIVPVVTGDLDPGAVEALITLCVQYDRLRGHAGSPGDGRADGAGPDGGGSTGPQAGPGPGGSAAEVLAMLEHQILAAVIAVVSGPGGWPRSCAGTCSAAGWAGRRCRWMSGRPTRSRRTCGALRDQGCQYPGGCDQPAAGREPHHVVHRAGGGRTSLANLKDYCWWHHHVVLHELGWTLTVHPDGTSQVQSPAGKIIRSHSPPPRPG